MIRARIELHKADFTLQAELALPARGVTAIYGPSGSGKTLLLRTLAGLERPASGHIAFGGELWQDDAQGLFVPTHRRGVGYVFQEPSLLTQHSVRRNLEFGLLRTPAPERTVGWDQAVELLRLGPLLERAPAALSGGERQRVAIARALLASPRLLLLDEPLAALDLARREEILPYLARLQRELALPLLYVSHQIEEVAALAQHLVLLERGRVLAAGALVPTLARLDLPTAQEDHAGVVIEARGGGYDPQFQLARLSFAGGSFELARAPIADGAAVRIRVQARDVSLALSAHTDSSILNRLEATVVQLQPAANPANVLVRLDVGGTALLARITRRSQQQLGIAVGSRVWAQVKSVALIA